MGAFGDAFSAEEGSLVTIYGDEFLLNGTEVLDTTLKLQDPDDILTGTLKDGSPFIIAAATSASSDGVVFKRSSLPELNTTPIMVDSELSPNGLRRGQRLTLTDGGELPRNFNVVGAELEIIGGSVDLGLRAADSRMEISGGTVQGLRAFDESVVHVRGGLLEDRIHVHTGSQLSIGGGQVGTVGGSNTSINIESGGLVSVTGAELIGSIIANDGGYLNVSGGRIDRQVVVRPGSKVDITGGTIESPHGFALRSDGSLRPRDMPGGTTNISGGKVAGATFASGTSLNLSGGTIGKLSAERGSNVTIFGGEFRLNGIPFDGEVITLTESDVFAGTLENGTPFIFLHGFDVLHNARIVNATLPPVVTTPIIVPSDESPAGLRSGQTLILEEGEIRYFNSIAGRIDVTGGRIYELKLYDSELNLFHTDSDGQTGYASGVRASHNSRVRVLQGGFVNGLTVSDSTVEIDGGSVNGSLEVHSTSTVNLASGTIRARVDLWEDATLNISGGSLRHMLTARPESTIDMSGGSIEGTVSLWRDSVLTLSGGSISNWAVFGPNTVNLIGTEFQLDGTEIDNLRPGQRTRLDNRSAGSTISGLLADGTEFAFDFRLDIPTASILTVTLVPEPASSLVLLTVAILSVGGVGRRYETSNY